MWDFPFPCSLHFLCLCTMLQHDCPQLTLPRHVGLFSVSLNVSPRHFAAVEKTLLFCQMSHPAASFVRFNTLLTERPYLTNPCITPTLPSKFTISSYFLHIMYYYSIHFIHLFYFCVLIPQGRKLIKQDRFPFGFLYLPDSDGQQKALDML